MTIVIRVAGKTVAKEAGKAVARVAVGVGCEVATYLVSNAIIKKIKEHKEEKELDSKLEEAGIYDEPADYE